MGLRVMDSQVDGFPGYQDPRFMSSWVYRFTRLWITVFQIYGFLGSRVMGLQITGSRVYGFPGSGFPGSQVPGFPSLQLPGFLGLQVCGFLG